MMGGARRSAASQRQLELKAKQEEKVKKEKEKGPGWYYVLEPTKSKKIEQPPPNALLGNFLSNRCCINCEEADGDQILKCKGLCGGHFHPSCLNLESNSGKEDGTFKCTQCLTNRHVCFICKKFGDEHLVKKEGKNAEHLEKEGTATRPTKKCAMACAGCGKWYHLECRTETPLWPQARVSAALCCPAHTCHTCASENTKDPVMK